MAKPSVVTTFVIYDSAGNLVIQNRNYVSAEGNPVGSPGMISLFGKHHGNGDTNVAAVVFSELGINVDSDDISLVGPVQDATVPGRTNMVYKVSLAYDTALVNQNPNSQDMMDKIRAAQGMGVHPIGKADLAAAIAAGQVSDISVQILKAFPRLKPKV